MHHTLRAASLFARQPLALAAATALLGCAALAQAQSFSQSGANSTYPNNLLPFSGSPASLDFGSDVMSIGSSGIGSFSALAGAVFTAAGMNLGDGLGIGTVTVTGAGSKAGLGAFSVANWGTGTLTVSAGGVVDATTLAASCLSLPSGCFNAIGNGAGSTGVVTITGTNSEVRTLRNLNIGQTAVFTVAQNGFDFGTPGGTTTANVSVLDGATFRTERVTVGTGPNLANNPAALGTEKANGTVTVSGTGSLWELTHNSIDATNNVAGLTIGANANGTGVVTVSNGGTLRVVGSSASDSLTDFINIGVNGGKGTLTLTGANSKLDMLSPAVAGAGSVIQVGRSGAGSDGTFSVLAGATASATFLNVGRDGANGTVLIDGAGSLVTLSGLGTWASSQVGGSATSIGWNGGSGKVTVSNGGRLLVTDGGVDTSTSAGSMAINLGYIGGTGQMFIDGAGSTVEIASTSIAPAPGMADNFNPFMAVGRDSGGTGELTITNGGKLLLTGSALSTPANPRATGLSLGGTSNGNGTGAATVTGIGSQIVLSGNDSNITVGRSAGGNGTFSVLAGATASAVFFLVGRDGANGTVLLDGSGSTLSLAGQGVYSSGGTGPAGSLIGWGGTGHMTVSNGALWTITDGFDTSALPSRGPFLTVGTNSGSSIGTGTLTISGAGSKVQLTSTSISPATGAADNFNPAVRVGSGAGNQGTIDIADGGQLVLIGNALSTPTFGRPTNLFIGGDSDSDSAAGGSGAVTVSGAGSQLRLEGADTFVAVGRNGNGTLSLDSQALLYIGSGGINVGRATSGVGVLNVDDSSIEISGQYASDTTSGAFMSIGNRGGSGTANIGNGSRVTLTNPGSSGASLNVGGTSTNPLGTGVLNLSGGSTINVAASAGLASMNVGRDGTGTVTLSGMGTQIDIGDGNLHVGRLPTGVGTVSIESGAKLLTGSTNIGGSSDADAGGMGSVTVSGAGSELRASGASGFIGVGRGGAGTLTVADQATVSAIGMAVGRSDGTGTLITGNATLAFSGQQTTGTLSGAFFSIGSGGTATGTAALSGTTVTISNAGSGGAALNIGGSGNFSLGTGTLAMVNSTVTLNAAAGLGSVSIGRTGTGIATLSNSAITNADGNVFVGRDAGGTGSLVLTNGSVVDAGYVGIGVSQPYDGTQHNGGTGVVVLNDSTINADRFEIGAGGVLAGSNGVLNVSGDVIVGGVISPGNSPGRLRINCNIITLPGSQLILDVEDIGQGLYAFDELLIGHDSTFDLHAASIVFNFIGNTNPESFAASGQFDLDTFLRSVDGNTESGLSSVFAAGQHWDDVVASSQISAMSSAYDVTTLTLQADGSFHVVAVPVPEPATWGLMFFGLLALGGYARWQRRAAAATRA